MDCLSIIKYWSMATTPQTMHQRRKAAGLGPQVRRPSPSELSRESSTKRGYGFKWQQYTKTRLYFNPLCVICLVRGLLVTATLTDHIIPHKRDMNIFWDRNNHQSLCKPCHDHKTATEDGGFGRPVVSGASLAMGAL